MEVTEEERFKDLTKFLRFFEIKDTNIEAKFKFNQNKSKEDIEKVIQSLRDNQQVETANFIERITNSMREV